MRPGFKRDDAYSLSSRFALPGNLSLRNDEANIWLCGSCREA
jgi:hypothetical protein